MKYLNTIFVLLLAYIIVALGFWEGSLQKLSGNIYTQELTTLRSQIDSAANPEVFNQELKQIEDRFGRRTKQYIGEGSVFLVVIILGAAIVYTSFRRRMQLTRQQNNFMLSVTHELKSPIAAVKLSLQTMEKHRLSEEQQNKLIDRCVIEANRLNDLCNNILFASQLEGGTYKSTHEVFDYTQMADDIIHEYEVRYIDRFHVELEDGLRVNGDRTMLQMVIANLLENAVKYTPISELISVKVYSVENKIITSVADLGTGIPDVEKKKIFTKFYRVGNEETRKAKGTGLGLYLVNMVVVQHKGSVTVKDNQPTGSIFEVSLPMA